MDKKIKKESNAFGTGFNNFLKWEEKNAPNNNKKRKKFLNRFFSMILVTSCIAEIIVMVSFFQNKEVLNHENFLIGLLVIQLFLLVMIVAVLLTIPTTKK